jgi:hypothetical protein
VASEQGTTLNEAFACILFWRDAPALRRDGVAKEALAKGGDEIGTINFQDIRDRQGHTTTSTQRRRLHQKTKRFRQVMLTHKQMHQLLQPYAQIFAIKMRDQVRSCAAADKYLDALEGDDPTAQEKAAERYDATFVQRAWADKGDLQKQFCRASDYTDEWFNSHRNGGTYAMRCYYVCMALTGPWDFRNNVACRCGTLTRTDMWERKFDDPLATGQKWYCGDTNNCAARYKTKFGMLVEFVMGNQAFYCRAPICDFHAFDAKALLIQEKVAHLALTNPHDLLAHIPKVEPVAVGTHFRQVLRDDGRPKEGVYKFAPDTFDALPEMQWASLYCWATSAEVAPLVPGSAAWRAHLQQAQPAGEGSVVGSTAAGDEDGISVTTEESDDGESDSDDPLKLARAGR